MILNLTLTYPNPKSTHLTDHRLLNPTKSTLTDIIDTIRGEGAHSTF